MRKILALAALFLPIYLGGAVPVTPIIQPHMTFVNAAGLPCAGCQLFSYVAGTTTPQPTYTDAIGTTQNPNPIVLGADGGPQTPTGSSGGIWFSYTAYKLILKDPTGTTIWTVDNINTLSLFPCGPAGAVQIANLSVTGLTCDSNIFISTTSHTLNVGSLGPNHVVIAPQGTPTLWTFDTTSPATALASLNGVSDGSGTTTANQLLLSTTTAHSIVYSSSIPSAITATTQAISDNSTKVATTAYVETPGVINPTSLQIATGSAMTANQGTGASVQHSTGTTTTGDCVKYDSTGNTIDSGSPCATVSNYRDLVITSGICTTSGAETQCALSPVNWPTPFADSSYAVTCSYVGIPSGTGTHPGLYGPYVTNKTATSITVVIQAGSASAAGNNTVPEIDCHGSHL